MQPVCMGGSDGPSFHAPWPGSCIPVQEQRTAALGMSVGPVPLQPGSKKKTQKGKWHLFLGAKVSPLHQSVGVAWSGTVAPPEQPAGSGRSTQAWARSCCHGCPSPGHCSRNFPVVQAGGRRATHTWLQQGSQPRQQELKIPAVLAVPQGCSLPSCPFLHKHSP